MAEEKKIGTLVKVLSIKREINVDTTYDAVLLWYRDKDGIKRTKFIDRAKVPYYIIKNKESEEAKNPPMFIEREKVDEHLIWSDSLYREIALQTDAMEFYDRCRNEGRNTRNMMNLLKHPYIYNADMDVADRYIKYFNEEFEPDIEYKLHKCYFDIEVDLMPNGFNDAGYIGFPDEEIAPCPINIITLIDSKTMIIYTFIVKNHLNDSQTKFLPTIETWKSEMKGKILERNNTSINDIVIGVYEKEEEAIEAFFRKVHEIDPDIMCAWNQSFDVKTLMNRLSKIYSRKKEVREQGLSGKDKMLSVVCDPKYFIQKNHKDEDVYLTPKAYYKDQKEKSIVDRMDEFTVLDGIMWLDQMCLYANVRKSSGMKESYALDAIAEEELGSSKLDYTGYTIKNLPWKNFQLFTEYNIFDVVLLVLLENKNLDLDMLQRLSEITNTRHYKVFRKTVSIKNFVNKFAESQGYVMTDNKNASYGTDSEYFEQNFLRKKDIYENDSRYLELYSKKDNYGAYVGDPNLNDACGVDVIPGHPSMFMFENVFDEDFSSLYPSLIRAYNLDTNTLVNKFFWIDPEIKEKLKTKYGYDDSMFSVSKNDESKTKTTSTDDLGLTFVDSLTSKNWTRIGQKFFDLPSVEEVTNLILEKVKE